MSLGTRAISRIPGAAGDGFTNAKKLADFFVSSNTNDAGVVSNSAVYQTVIDDILAPYSGTIDGQNLIADYTNKKKKLEFSQNETETTVAALKEEEYVAWYISDDGSDDVSFRNPSWVARETSESLDMLVAKTLFAISEAESNDKSTSELNSYLNGLVTRSDRMRTVSTSLEEGDGESLDGYGYFIDSDPNTGEIRGASFMPTDAEFGGLATNKKRTNSTITVGNKKVPIYLPYITDDQGIEKSQLGGVQYEDDGEVLYSQGSEDVALTDRSAYRGVTSKIQLGQMYQTFNGKTNVDGSFKKDYVYIGNDNTVYKFADDDPKGQEFLASMKEAGVVGENIPRLNPADVADFYTQPLPEDSSLIPQQVAAEQRFSDLPGATITQGSVPITQRVGSFFGKVFGGGEEPEKTFSPTETAQSTAPISKAINVPDRPDEPGASIGGRSSSPDVIDAGRSFFQGKVQ